MFISGSIPPSLIWLLEGRKWPSVLRIALNDRPRNDPPWLDSMTDKRATAVGKLQVFKMNTCIAPETFAKFLGTARVPIQRVVFPEQEDFDTSLGYEEKIPVKKRVERMRQIFLEEGCRPLERRNFLPAIMSRRVLEHLVNVSDTSLHSLLENPMEVPPLLSVPADVKIFGLQGLHRIEAAKLLKSTEWWTVELYDISWFFYRTASERTLNLLGISMEARKALRYEFDNAANFSDGYIFKEVQHHHRLKGTHGEKRWLARLTCSKRSIARRVLKKESLNQALYNLHEVPGLWIDDDGFKIGVLHKMLAIRSDEVCCLLLDLID